MQFFTYAADATGAVTRTVLMGASALASLSPSIEVQVSLWNADLAATYSASDILGGYPALAAQLGTLVSGISGLQETGSGTPFTTWTQQRRVGVARTVMAPASATDASAGYVQTTIGGYSGTTIRQIFNQQLALAGASAQQTPAVNIPAQAVSNANAIADAVRQAALIESFAPRPRSPQPQTSASSTRGCRTDARLALPRARRASSC